MKLMTIDAEGRVKLKEQFTYPGWEFLAEIFSSFSYLTPDSEHHFAMLHSFINSEMMRERFEQLSPTDIALENAIFNSLIRKIQNLEIKTLGQVYNPINRIDKANNMQYKIRTDFTLEKLMIIL